MDLQKPVGTAQFNPGAEKVPNWKTVQCGTSEARWKRQQPAHDCCQENRPGGIEHPQADCRAEQAHHANNEKQEVPSGGELPAVHIAVVFGFWQGASAGRTLFFVLYKWLSSLRKPKRCCPRSGQTLQSRTRHCRQCGCRHAHRRSFRQRHTNRGSHFPAYQGPLRLC